MSEEKKIIVRDLGFGGLMHIPPLRVHHQILRELANSFKLGKNRLETGYGSFKIRQKTIGAALGINASGITDYKLKKKKAIDGCLFALMIIYFHLSKNKDKKRAERPPKPWIANWTKEQLVERMRVEMEEHMGIVKMVETKEKMKEMNKKQKTKKRKASSTSSSETETTQSDHYTSKSETEEDSEDSTRKQPTRKVKKMESKKRKKIQEDSDSESESTDKTQSKKKKVVVEDLSPEQAQSYHGEKQVDLRSPEGHYISYETILDVNLESDDPSSQGHTEQTEENMMVMREETPSEVLAITPEPPQQLEESTPTLPPTPSKINPAPEDAAAMMMMAWRASYVPRIDPMPSFSFGSTDSSQEETATQEGASMQDGGRAKTPETPKLLEQLGDLVQKIVSGGMSTKEKSPQIPKESGAKSFEKFETPARMNENSSDMKEKCYLWTLQVKTDADGRTNEFDNIVSAMCFILNQKKIPRFQEEVYCLPPDIVNMAIINHPKGVFLQPTTNKPFKVEDYPMFIPFLDLKKLASHHYDKDKEIEPPYLNILGQKTSYDCAIYVMKWLEILNPANINRRKYEWENWSQDEVDHFRVEYASRILFHDMNLDKAEAIRGSNAIRLFKPSSFLLSPYCQIDSEDIDTD
ncbi:hypothetical protein Ahy_A01g001395 [Arachis hypogaea]|uniref:Ubiquitin-like protease family profile domain-containing protein n=1 Tax=Arachis hypogaea TaxID=3818 RepID=A0A445EN55_ARAHY|nr:hypothetical protein Ahy_A01g001395 [Arachis hypogaea]